jgi:hypothetical protein
VVVASNGDFSGCFSKQTHNALHRGTFARPIGAQQAYYFATSKIKADVLDSRLLLVLF